MTESRIIEITDMTHEQFLHTYAAAGRIGLGGGITLIDKMIGRAQRHIDDKKRWSQWSHAFFFQGKRPDNHHWVIESDMDLHRKHVRFGVQENRIGKFLNTEHYGSLAILDFNLSEQQVQTLLSEALDLVSSRCKYSVRELVGTLIALRHSDLRSKDNILSRPECFYCSAFVSHLFQKAGLTLAPGIGAKNTTPEDISRTLIPHTMWVLRPAGSPKPPRAHKLRSKAARVREKLRSIRKSR